MSRNRWIKKGIVVFTFLFFFLSIFEIDAFARVGGGRSFGGRGSRSSTPPRSYSAPKPVQPSTPSSQLPPQSQQQPLQQPRISPWGGIMGGIMGGILGGMLFRSLGFGGDLTGEGSGIGLFEILLIGALLYAIYWFIKRRRQAAIAGGNYQSSFETVEPYQTSYGQTYEPKQEGE